MANVLPLTSGARRAAGTRYSAVAAVFIAEAGRQGTLPYDMIAQRYQLTAAELRVLFGIVEIGGVPEVAAAFGVADATIKTHVSRLYEKTGTGRQADLVRLVAGFSMPVARERDGARV